MGYIIGSFNMHEFSGTGKHDLNTLANIILSENFDIVALQEIKRIEALNSLKSRLYGWEAKRGDNPQSGSSGDYGFGYLWNTRRVRECSKDSEPIIFSQYKSNIRIKRNPFYARFTPNGLPGGAFFEIRLINVHLHWGSQNANDVFQRKEEYRIISNDIHNYIYSHGYGNNMPAYTIILGDYNLEGAYCNLVDGQYQSVTTKQLEKTTLSSNKDEFSSNYDHFSYNEDRFSGASVIIERVDSVMKYCSNSFEKHREIVSDHVPIKMELILN